MDVNMLINVNRFYYYDFPPPCKGGKIVNSVNSGC